MQYTILFVVLAALTGTQAITFTRCNLARALLVNGMPRNQLETWVCLVEAESNGNTNALNTKNSNGSKDYGLFQINSVHCSTNGIGGDCNANCNSFLDDNIADDSKCARSIAKNRGDFSAWTTWKTKCTASQLPNLKSCNL